VTVYLGGASGLATTPAATLNGDYPFGRRVNPAGDVNGDGYADITTASSVIFGGPSGLLACSPTVEVVVGTASTADFLEPAGDVNGDGRGDLLLRSSGSVLSLFLGTSTGPAATPATTINKPAAAPVAESFSNPKGACDFNGDGLADVVVGAPIPASPNPQTFGSAYVYLSSGAGLPTAPNQTLAGVGPGPVVMTFGSALACTGDSTGDGFQDLIVSAPTANQYGVVYAYKGSSTGTLIANGSTNGSIDPSFPTYGAVVAGAGDVDGNGLDDYLVSATGANTVHLYLSGVKRIDLVDPSTGYGVAIY
jgi:hypothetical protein